MSKHEYVLSVCIPTFNRLHYLKESLDILLPQAQRLGVEVCVSDNHSTDETAGYLATMSNIFPNLRYVVQDENVGLDRNMAAVISMGSGCYIYPLGDDDVLPTESVSIILNEVNADSDADMIILNGWHTDAFISPIREHLLPDLQGRQFSSPEDAFFSLWDKMPFGSFLASKDSFSVRCFDRFIGTSHAYSGAVWDMLAEKYRETGKCKVKCMSTATVLLRGAEKTWKNDAAHIMLFEIPLWLSQMAGCYQKTAEQISNNYFKMHLRYLNLLQYRAVGQLDHKLLNELKAVLSVKQYNYVNFVVNIPKFIASTCWNVYVVLRWVFKRFNKI